MPACALHADRDYRTYRVKPDVSTTLGGDPGRLRQIIINLAENANKFSDKGSITIEVKTEKKE